MVGCFYKMKLMFLSATYCSSASQASNEINGAANFLTMAARVASALIKSMFLMSTLTADKSTAGLLCDNLGRIRSAICSASSESFASCVDMASRMKIYPHSLDSLTAAKSLFKF